MISNKSRYAKSGTVVVPDASGTEVELVALRERPQLAAVLEIEPRPGERLDHLAHRYYRDSTKFWRICDASSELDPFDVVVVGEPLAIPPSR